MRPQRRKALNAKYAKVRHVSPRELWLLEHGRCYYLREAVCFNGAVLPVGAAPGLAGGVLAGALGLELRGVEDAIAAIGADGEGLGFILEGVGRRLGAFVVHTDGLIQFDQSELGVGTGALDGTGLDVAGHTQVLAVGLVAQGLELGDGDVILLGVARGGDGQPGDRSHDKGSGDDELQRGLGLRRHGF